MRRVIGIDTHRTFGEVVIWAHAPERLHEEISDDYRDMIYAKTKEEVEARRKAFLRNGGSNAARSPTAWERQATSC